MITTVAIENLNSGFELGNPGALPPSLIVFEGYMHRIDPLWHITGLGYRYIINVIESVLEDAVVIHFSGLAKPWLEIGAPLRCEAYETAM
ncbi:putative galacturonosyltransferase 14 [Capsicum chinense]|nr:putative galacturonosyltransferase 14 [Capsicum chinense]